MTRCRAIVVAIAVKKIQCAPKILNGGISAYPAALLSNLFSGNVKFSSKCKRECAMARRDVGYLPRENPCAQCGKLIAAPDWIENGPRRISYLWHCQACDYEFEAVAFYDASKTDIHAIAA
jgi:hypothetical protein